MAFLTLGRKIIGGRVQPIVPEQRYCPQCGCVLDRPHALSCSRCLAEIPWASGCSGCGKCHKK